MVWNKILGNSKETISIYMYIFFVNNSYINYGLIKKRYSKNNYLIKRKRKSEMRKELILFWFLKKKEKRKQKRKIKNK